MLPVIEDVRNIYDVRLDENSKVKAVGCSITGRVRKANEDSCDYRINTVNGELFVVCDGMGGHVGGATASRIAVERIVRYMTAQKHDDVAGALRYALQDANLAIISKTVDEPSLKGMGTTACILLVQDDKAWIAHIGDSRIYIYTSDTRKLHRITKDHSYVQRLVDMGELQDHEAETHANKNVILKALGIKPDLSFDAGDVVEHPIRPVNGDVFMLCSDGLTGMLYDNNIESILRGDESLDQKLTRLLDEANAEGKGTDNITVQLVEIKNSNLKTVERFFEDYNPEWRRTSATPAIRTEELPVYKKKRPSAWVWILISVLAVIGVSLGVTLAILSSQDKIEEIGGAKAKSVSVLSRSDMKKKQELEEDIEKLNVEITNLEEKIKRSENAIKNSGANIDDQRHSNFAKKLDDAKSELEHLKKKREKISAQLKEYEKGRRGNTLSIIDLKQNGRDDDRQDDSSLSVKIKSILERLSKAKSQNNN